MKTITVQEAIDRLSSFEDLSVPMCMGYDGTDPISDFIPSYEDDKLVSVCVALNRDAKQC